MFLCSYRALCDQVKRLRRKFQSHVIKEEEDHVIAEAVRIYDLYFAAGPKVSLRTH